MISRSLAWALICLFNQALHPASTFTLMQFNIEDGGTLISLDQIVRIIHTAKADTVCISEAGGNLPLLAEKLEWPFYDIRLHLLSRYPLIDPPGGKGIYTYVEVRPGQVVAVSNVHLPAEQYGPHLFIQGMAPSTIAHVEKTMRLAELEQHLKVLPSLAAQGIPTFLAGDFNAPSHLDWTEEASQSASSSSRCPICQVPGSFTWPVSKALEEAGFKDSYRDIHPNPLKAPGFTWWAERPQVLGWNPSLTDPHDRIDFIYAAGPIKTLTSERIGSCCATSIFSPWPSDHCAVVSTFEVTPAQAPTLIGVHKRVLQVGEPVKITYHAPQEPGHIVTIVPAEKKTIALGHTLLENNGQGTATFSTHGWIPQTYEAHLASPTGTILSRITFVVKASGDHPKLILTKNEFNYGEPIVVSWKQGLGNRGDWLGIIPRDGLPEDYVMWEYTKAELEGTYSFDSSRLFDWPLAPGNYTLGYFIDDTVNRASQVDFIVHQDD